MQKVFDELVFNEKGVEKGGKYILICRYKMYKIEKEEVERYNSIEEIVKEYRLYRFEPFPEQFYNCKTEEEKMYFVEEWLNNWLNGVNIYFTLLKGGD